MPQTHTQIKMVIGFRLLVTGHPVVVVTFRFTAITNLLTLTARQTEKFFRMKIKNLIG